MTTGIGETGQVATRYRQAEHEPRPGFLLTVWIAIALPFVGAFGFWIGTGSWDVKVTGQLSGSGPIIWLGPVLLLWVMGLVGPHGPLARLWFPDAIVELRPDGLIVRAGDEPWFVWWGDIGAVTDEGVAVRPAIRFAIRDRAGNELGRLPLLVKRVHAWGLVSPCSRGAPITDVMLRARPDVFVQPAGPSYNLYVRAD